MTGARPARTRLIAVSMLGIVAALAAFVVILTVRYRDGLEQRPSSGVGGEIVQPHLDPDRPAPPLLPSERGAQPLDKVGQDPLKLSEVGDVTVEGHLA